MQEFCFARADLNPPECAVHNAPLLPRQIPIDGNAPELGLIACHICPVSRAVVLEPKGSNARNLR
jgi:hypothetical protein